MTGLVDVTHIRTHVHCTAKVKDGRKCTAMTNTLCAHCNAAICGRHETGHYCPRSGWTR